ncbi:MAG: DHA2 family efflux MFS transporter permease subunit [Hyphomicrobiales bacterium]
MADLKEPLDRRAILGLVAMALAVLVIANDFTALSVALPAIEAEFGADVTTVQWVINGYALVFGVLIVTGGRLADMFGRRKVFFIGTAIFSIFSLLGGLAPNIWILLLSRGAMGIGGALMWPAILGMTYALLPKSRAGLAGGLILGAAGLGNAVGPLLGGTLTDALSWRWIFFLNLPIAGFAVLVTLRVVAKDGPNSANHRIDYAGVTALSVGLFALLLALDEGATRGWLDPMIVGLFILAAASLVVFAMIERRAGAHALVPADVLTNRAFVAACLTTLLMSAIFFAALLYLPQFMTKQLSFSAVGSGAGLLPMMGIYAIVSFIAGPLYERLGAKIVVSAGAAFLAAGMYLLSRIDVTSSYNDMILGMVVLGVGVGLFYSSITTAAVTALGEARTSLAGGLVYMCQIAGGSIGLGLNTAIAITAPSLVNGIGRAFLVDAVLAVCGLAVAILYVGGRIGGMPAPSQRAKSGATG